MNHMLWRTGDFGAPDQIKDRNGEVCLAQCRLCGKAEVELDLKTECTPVRHIGFVELCALNLANFHDIDLEVEKWHEGRIPEHLSGISLIEFLGFTVEEYADWMKDSTCISRICRSRLGELKERRRIDIEEVRRLYRRIEQINNTPMGEIDWYEDGNKVEIQPQTLNEWKFVGMSHVWFIMTEAYKGFTKEPLNSKG